MNSTAKLLKELEALGLRFFNSACGGITIGAAYDCNTPIVPGVNQRLLLGNQSDIEEVTYNVTTPSLITDIEMKTGKRVWVFDGVRQSLTPQYELVPGTVTVGYLHTVNFLAFDISQAAKDNYEKMALGKLFAIIENKNAVGNGDSIFEVYGIQVGLEATAITRIPADQETGGAFTISLTTPEAEGKEPKMPQSWWDTDYATTLAKVEALLTPAA